MTASPSYRFQGRYMDATQLVLQFSVLQGHLVDELVRSLALMPNWNVITDVPWAGAIMAYGEEWAYQKHGAGVMFTGRDSRRVVDAHTFMERWPSAVDAWRLSLYAESVGAIELTHRGIIYPAADERKVDECLAALNRDRALRAEEGGRIWVPNLGST